MGWPQVGDFQVAIRAVTDMTSCLVWLKNASWGGELSLWAESETWNTAQNRPSVLKDGVGGLSDGSVEGDWRQPTKNELSKLANGTEAVRSSNMRAFTGVQPYYYWSSSYAQGDVSTFKRNAWIVNLSDGIAADQDKKTIHYVWAVR